MNFKFLYFLTIVLLVTFKIKAQEDLSSSQNDLKKPKLSNILAIDIDGDNKYTSDQISLITKIYKTDSIEISGNSINVAIKKLWATNSFSDIQVFVNKIDEKNIKLKFTLTGFPTIGEVKINGISKSKAKDLIDEVDIKEGKTLTSNLQNQIQLFLNNLFEKKGFPEPTFKVIEKTISTNLNKKNIEIVINKGPRVKINEIKITGNQKVKSKKILKLLGKTKVKYSNPIKKSKIVKELFEEDLKKVELYYKSIGYRDFEIEEKKINRINSNNSQIDLKVNEGKKYYLGNIEFSGNSSFDTELLKKVFSYSKGEPFDAGGVDKKIANSEKDDDLQTLYLDSGFLFANVELNEVAVREDSIDIKIIIREGEKARYNRITFSGNKVTQDKIIQRELRTKPGDLFSKSNLKRTYFGLSQLGFFEPQSVSYDLNPNPQNNTVDLHWKMEEKSASQIELQGGYGGDQLIGTLGLTFNNFSIENIFNKSAWTPIPQGSGQNLSLRAQVAQGFRNFSFGFTEPWIGGKKPTSLSIGASHTFQTLSKISNLSIYGGNLGLNKLLSWPDDYFSLNQSISYQYFAYTNYQLIPSENKIYSGSSNNLSFNIQLNRRSQGPDPIFPTSGSDIQLSLKITPPYSLFKNIDYSTISTQERFKWLEYYKFRLNTYWYQEIIGKLVVKAGGEFGFLSTYNNNLGVSPFERFYMGGSGLAIGRIDGREIISLRGYHDPSSTGGEGGDEPDITPLGGGVAFNKFMLEFRYPITMGNSAKIWVLSFVEAGSIWRNMSEFDPFKLKKSVGFGVRVFMPAFGLLGFDLGYGFDKANSFSNVIPKFLPHLIIGQQF